MTELHLLSDDETDNNDYMDMFLTFKAVIGTATSATGSQIAGVSPATNWPIFVEETEPVDSDMPDGTLIFWFSSAGMGVNRRLEVKYKDRIGTIRTASIAIVT
ncbi:MAG: hypothetical protein ACE5NA_00035 [Nitrospiraceae bacterium]